MTVTLPLPFLAVVAVGATMIVAAVTALLVQAWYDAAVHRRSWIDQTVRPTCRAAAATLSRLAHHLVAHPLLVLCPPVGRRLHDVTDPGGDR
jgi:hypothetical protein